MSVIRSPRYWAVLTVVLLVVVGVAVIGLRGASDRSVVSAYFADASPLVAGNKVQLSGVEVGTIEAITLENGQAKVDLSLDPGVLPLHTDASARIAPVSLLGERFVQLERGSRSAPFDPSSHPVIPQERTSASVDLDQVLNSVDDPTSTALASMVTGLGEGVAGQGDQAAQALKALEPAMRDTGALAGVLDRQNALIDRLVVQTDKNVGALAPPLDGLVDSSRRTLQAVADRRGDLDAAAKELPSTLEAFHATLGKLSSTVDVTRDNLGSLRPLTDRLPETSTELKAFADAANPAFDALPPTLDKLDGTLRAARPVVDELGPAARDLRSVSRSARPLADELLRHRPGVASHLENVLTGVSNWAMATSNYDGLSHYFAAVLVPQPAVIGTVGGGTLPPGVLPPTNPVPPDPNGRTTDRTSATGMDPQQEGRMFDQLLGGGQ